ncbi:F-BOX/KELCH-REPEAT PROTEIN SKIP4 [Salix koriyanagi]|uniref:F-BOX/KELCH-REPEAT PROTEIN SKIP4 n=1 Tax=Salix koriyanagi TaxID=2511006 RepID=A0A9Q0SUS1_9ROSI|nr:F-BOX/KELCH-REPEAT PROTEIN SKIP4 [Salix koriyanagi]
MEATKTSVEVKRALEDDQKQQLIPGLPDEIAMECLVRVPYQFHSNMKSVCHTWLHLNSHPSFFQQRLQSAAATAIKYLKTRDEQAAAAHTQSHLMPRSFSACGVVGPSAVCVAGGHDSQKNALRSAEAYDVETDQWKMLPGMIEERDEFQGLSWERGFHGTGCVNRDKYQWSWFLGGEQQSQQQQIREAVKVSDNVRLEIVSSTPLPNCITGTTTCGG